MAVQSRSQQKHKRRTAAPDLVTLFLRPRQFFAAPQQLIHAPTLYMAGWIVGIIRTLDRLNDDQLRANGNPTSAAVTDSFTSLATLPWAGFWVFLLCVGALAGLMTWLIGGWWYRVRIEWSGATEVDKQLARAVYIYSYLVEAAPAVLVLVIQTFFYENYAAAYASDELYWLPLIFLSFWSLFVSYWGARARFAVEPWKARLWFLILPASLYLIGFGILFVAFFLQGAAW